MEIIDSTGASVVKYTYNAWGRFRSTGNSTIASLVTGNNQFGSIQDYAVSFTLGGIVGFGKTISKKAEKIIKFTSDFIVSPISSQVNNIVFGGGSFSWTRPLVQIGAGALSNIFNLKFGRDVIQKIVTTELVRILNL